MNSPNEADDLQHHMADDDVRNEMSSMAGEMPADKLADKFDANATDKATDHAANQAALKPLTLLICALGGEGGGVLTGWLAEVARRCDFPAQATSVPGVAQRTGATTYYVEIWPQPRSAMGDARPVFSLSPVPGALDAVIASELLEAARCACNGLPSPDRTLFMASDTRALTNAERSHPGDGRLDRDALRDIVQSASRTLHVFDMQAIARQHGTVVSAVMLGAIAGSGVFPFPRDAYEAVVQDGGRGAQASLAGFNAAYGLVAEGQVGSERRPSPTSPAELTPSTTPAAFPPELAEMPAVVADIAALGHARCCEYQDRRYGSEYLQRLRQVLEAERAADPEGKHAFAASRELARWLALWMCYDDIARVAHLKSRQARAERVRREARAGDRDLLHVHDYFKPGIPEIAGLLPPWLAERVTDWGRKQEAERGEPWALPLKLASHTVSGTLLLRLLASLRWLRRASSRYAQEQALIDEWLSAVIDGLRAGWPLGHEVAACGRLVKGYGSTNERGKATLLHLLRQVARADRGSADERAAQVRNGLDAALADDTGKALDRVLAEAGAAPRPVREQPIRWMPTAIRRGVK